MPEFDPTSYFDRIAAVDAQTDVVTPTPAENLDAMREEKYANLERARHQSSIALNGLVASFGVGANRLLESAGTLYGLASGDMDNAARQQGAEGAEYFEERKPWTLQEKTAARSAAVEDADGEVAKFGTAIWETMKDPELFGSLLAEQIPMLIPGGVVGRGAKALTGSLKAATGGALGTGAALQGADVAGGVYDDVMALDDLIWNQNPEYVALSKQIGADEAKHNIAMSKSRYAMTIAASLSLATQRLPGGATIEKALAGSAKAGTGGFIKGAARGLLGEAVQEGLEEGSGAVTGNVIKQDLDSSIETFEGVGESAGLGALGGGILGGLAGGAGGAAKKFAEGVKIAADKQATQVAIGTAAVEATKTGDTSKLTDPKSPTYAPNMASAANSQIVTNPDEEITPEIREKARDEVTTDIEAVKDEITEIITKIEALPETEAADAEYNQLNGELTRKLKIMEAMRKTETQLKDVERQGIDTEALVSEAEKGNSEEALSLAMRDPEAFSDDEVSRLAKIEGPHQELFQAFSDANTALNTLKTISDVNNDVLLGNPTQGFKGLQQHRSDIGEAVRRGDKEAVRAQITALQEFRQVHMNKAKALVKAHADAKSTGKSQYLVRQADNSYTQTDVDPFKNNKERSQNGGYFVNPKSAESSELVETVKVEAEAITKLVDAMKELGKQEFSRRPTPAMKVPEQTPEKGAELDGGTPDSEGTVSARDESDTESSSDQPAPETDQPSDQAPPVEEGDPGFAPDDNTPDTVSEDDSGPAQPGAVETDERTDQDYRDQSEKELAELLSELETPLEEGVEPEEDLKEETAEHEVGTITLEGALAQFEQKTDEGKKSSNPLVQVLDFVSNATNELLRSFIDTDTLREDQRGPAAKYVGYFLEFARAYNPEIRHNITTMKVKKGDYVRKNYLSVMDRETFPENILSAIALAAFEYVANESGDLQHDDKGINFLLGRDSEEQVTNDERRLLAFAGKRENAMIQALGKTAAKALNLRAKPDAEANAQVQLELSLGAQAFALLMKQGYVERHYSNDEVLARQDEHGNDISQREDSGVLVAQSFVRLQQTTPGKLVQGNQQIFDASKQTGGILSKVFGIEQGLKEPALNRREILQKKIKNTLQGIPKIWKKRANMVARRSHFIRQDMRTARSKLDPMRLARIGGAKFEGEGVLVHSMNRVAQTAKNEQIMRELDRLDDFENSVGEKAFFFLPKFWVVQRAGLEENLVNPQTSKIQRHNISMKAWNKTLNASKDSMDMKLFKLAVAQGMGIDVDKLFMKDSLKKFETMRDQPDVRLAVAALQEISQGRDISEEQQQHIEDAIAGGGEKFHSLDSLVNLAEMELSLDQGREFTTDIMFEVDGVTNGPALSQILMGQGTKLRQLFGMYGKGEAKNYVTWKNTAGSLDLYETVASSIVKKMKHVSREKREVAEAIYGISGDLVGPDGVTKAGRNLIKQPLTSLMFGSGLKKTVRNMGRSLIHGSPNVKSIYEQLESAANAHDDEKIETILNSVNALLSKRNKINLNRFKSYDDVMNHFALNEWQEREIIKGFMDTLGEQVQETLEEEFGEFLTRRDQLNQMASAMWSRYNAMFEALRKERLKQLMAEDRMPFTTRTIDGEKVKIPLRDLTTDELGNITRILKPMAPIVHTVMSKLDGDLDVGMDVSKLEPSTVTKDDTDYGQSYGAEVLFSDIRLNSVAPKGAEKTVNNNAKGVYPMGMRAGSTEPGVRTIIMLVHALDSSIASGAYGDWASLNIHDALGMGIDQIFDGAKALNKGTFTALQGYSIPMEIAEALKRSMSGAEQIANDYPGFKLLMDETLGEVIVGRAPFDDTSPDTRWTPNDANVEMFYQRALAMEIEKQEGLAELEVVDQYAMEGGSYTVTDDDRMVSSVRVGELESQKTAPTVTEEGQAPTAQDLEDIGQTGAENGWGRLASMAGPVTKPDTKLEKHLADNPVTTIRALAPMLANRIKGGYTGKQAEFMRTLLGELVKAVPEGTEIRLITPDTPVEERSAEFAEAVGYVDWTAEGVKRVNIKSSAFHNSAVSAEVLLHELAHVASLSVIHMVENMEGEPTTQRGKDAKAAVEELEILRQYIIKNGLAENFGPEVTSNIHELVAYGMTNTKFQNEVLKKVKVKPLWSSFKNALAKLLLGSRAGAKETNGLGLLLGNAAVLLTTSQDSISDGEQQLSLKAINNPREYNTAQVLSALARGTTMSKRMEERLSLVMLRVTDAVHGPWGVFKDSAMATSPVNAEDVFLNALQSGVAPFATEAAAALGLNDAQAFVLESTEVTVDAALASSSLIHRDLEVVYNLAKKGLSAADFGGDQAAYDLIFNPQPGDTAKRYLARFTAAAMVHEGMITKMHELHIPIDQRDYLSQNMFERVKMLFERLMTRVTRLVSGLREGQTLDIAIQTLSANLASIEGKKMAKIQRLLDSPANLTQRLEDFAAEKADGVRGFVAEKATNYLDPTKNKLIQGLAGVTSIVAGERTEQVFSLMDKMINRATEGRENIFVDMLNEARGERDSNATMVAALTKASTHEQTRKQVKVEIAKIMRESFARELSRAELELVTTMVLTTDMASLTDAFSINSLEQMLTHPKLLAIEIKKLEASLRPFQHELYFLQGAKHLGRFMFNGQSKSVHQMLNAHNIAHLAGTKEAQNIAPADAVAAQKIIDHLASLYAIQHHKDGDKVAMAELMREESQREEGNGVDFTLKMAARLKVQANENLFEGSEVFQIKGYTKEIFSPHIEIVAANQSEGSRLLAAGYTKVTTVPLEKDPNDPLGEDRDLYLMDGKGLSTTQQGILSMTGRKLKGFAIHSGSTNLLNEEQRTNTKLNRQVSAARDVEIAMLFRTSRNMRVTDQGPNMMVPVLNLAGEPVNYRYMMETATKKLLRQDKRLDQVMGNMASSELDKKVAPIMNKTGIDALGEIWNAERLSNPEDFLDVSSNSTDPKIRERWETLPYDARMHARKVFGRNGMWVRKDVYNIALGYRKFSLSDMFGKDADTRNYAEKVFVAILENLVPVYRDGKVQRLGAQAALRVAQAENVWQELIKLTKDILVIKNVFTLLGNEMSNFTVLVIKGVPPSDIIKHKALAFGATFKYQKDRRERYALQTSIDVGYLTGSALAAAKSRLVELDDSIDRNIVKPIIDEGMFQTLVEDIAQEEDQYSYKSTFTEAVDKYTGGDSDHTLVKGARSVAKNVLLTHGSVGYKILNQATIFSDFTSRYVLHKYNTERAHNPLSKEESLKDARQAFVNYDLPTHQGIQYLNDTGILFFTKYYMRIQVAINQMVKTNPLGALKVLGMDNFFGGISDIMDSSMFTKSPINIYSGVLELPGAINEIAPLNAAGL